MEVTTKPDEEQMPIEEKGEHRISVPPAPTQFDLRSFLLNYLKNFAVGFSVKTIINLVSFFANKRKRRKFWYPAIDGPTRLTMLRRMVEWRLGFFLGGISTWKPISVLLRKLVSLRLPEQAYSEGNKKRLRSFLNGLSDFTAGGVAGMWIWCLNKQMTKSIAPYAFVRSWEFIFLLLAFRELLPWWVLKVGNYVDVILMCASASQILYAYVLERDTLDPLYAKFLILHGAKDIRLIDGVASEYKGWGFQWPLIQEWCSEHNADFRRIKRELVHGFNACCVIHPGQACLPHFITFFKDGFVRAAFLYIPVHLIGMGIHLLLRIKSLLDWRPSAFKRYLRETQESPDSGIGNNNNNDNNNDNNNNDNNNNKEKKSKWKTVGQYLAWLGTQIKTKSTGKGRQIANFILQKVLLRLGTNIARSSSFLGLYCATAWLTACVIFRCRMTAQRSQFRVVLAAAGLSSLLEVPTRRRELALYCVSHALESLVKEFRKYHLMPALLMSEGFQRNGNVVLFCFALATFVFCYRNEPKSVKPGFMALMKLMWGS